MRLLLRLPDSLHRLHSAVILVGPVDAQCTAVEVSSIQIGDSPLCSLCVAELTEAESLRAVCSPVVDKPHAGDSPSLREVIADVVLGRVVGDVSNSPSVF